MLIAFHGIDRPNAGDLRAATRPAHLEFQSGRANLVGGPLLDEHGEMCGSLLIFEATDIDAAATEMAADPYVQAGLFERVSITEFKAADWPGQATSS